MEHKEVLAALAGLVAEAMQPQAGLAIPSAQPEPSESGLVRESPKAIPPAQPTEAAPSVFSVMEEADALVGQLPPLGRLRSRKLWTMVGTVAVLASQHLTGLELSPVTEAAIAGVASIYLVVQGLLDGVKAGGGRQ